MHKKRIIDVDPKCNLGIAFHLTHVHLFKLFHKNSGVEDGNIMLLETPKITVPKSGETPTAKIS